jgi:uncharacterized protein involved in high-affinity Fe2+ transport
MTVPRKHTGRLARRLGTMATAALLISGCAAADKNAPASNTTSSGSSSSSMAGMNMNAAASKEAGSVAAVNGIKPVPAQMLSATTWQGMTIRAMAMTPVPFVIFNGTSEQLVKPTSHTSFHLMVTLNDAQTNEPIPYASVWATISKGRKVVFDERQWPMISRYLGPHYGNDVTLPGSGTYQLTLLLSPPESARHLEYQNVWLHPHRVTATFHWKAV